ncbi:MAG: HAMP domain-containing protein [Clostridia bacterium]|nr:HAMP domain-containing protein [Clostridia bacterium]
MAKESDIRRAGNLLSDNIDESDISALISQVSREYELCAMFVNAKTGEQLYKAHMLNNCILCGLTDSAALVSGWHAEAAKNDGECTIILPRNQFKDFDTDKDLVEKNSSEKCLIYTKILTNAAGDEYLLILNADIAPIPATANAVRIVLALATVVFCALTIFISLLLSKNLSKPIEKITKTAAELRAGDYKVRFEDEGPQEIRELADTLNAMTTELDRADSIQKELVANISHDLRTPLTMISGYSEFMRDFPSEVTPENMQVIIDEASRLNSLVNDLLLVSKLQSGAQAIEMKKICLTKVISDTVKRYETLLSHKEYKISFIHDGDVYVSADETRLLQVIYNLVNNAINYTGEDKTVTIRQDVLDDIVRISIIDTGEGISEENLPLVWDRYYKIDKVHKRAILGTGLGLSIVKNILMLHNSRFGVSSEVSKGSTFWFELKVIDK